MQRGTFGYPARVATGAAFCMGFFLMAAAGVFDHLSLAREFSNTRAVFPTELLRHIGLVAAATFLALIIGAPLTVLVLRKKAVAGFTFASLGLVQTIPSIALFGVLIAPMSKVSVALPFLRELGINGTGPAPALVALALYSLLPLVLPALISGLRVVTIQAIGLASFAALIGAGALGTFTFQGIGQYALDLV